MASFEDLSPSTQTVVVVLLPVVMAGAIYYYLLAPLSQQRDQLAVQVQTLESQNMRNRAFESQRGAYLKRIAELGVQLKALQATVPDEVDADAFINSVTASAKSAGVHIRSLVAMPPLPRESYVEVPFKLRIDGTYYDMLGFFDRLAGLQRIASVGGLALGSPGGGGLGKYEVMSSETVGANFVLTTYYNRQPLPPAAPKR